MILTKICYRNTRKSFDTNKIVLRDKWRLCLYSKRFNISKVSTNGGYLTNIWILLHDVRCYTISSRFWILTRIFFKCFSKYPHLYMLRKEKPCWYKYLNSIFFWIILATNKNTFRQKFSNTIPEVSNISQTYFQ